MLAIIQNASVPVVGDMHLPGKYAYSFWALNKRIVLVSDKPFSRNNIVKVEPTDQPNIFYVDPTTAKETHKSDLHNIGFLVPLATDIPFSSDVDYKFEVNYGNAQTLCELRNCVKDQTYYLMLMLCRSNVVELTGRDQIHNDAVEFRIDLRPQFKEFIAKYTEELS